MTTTESPPSSYNYTYNHLKNSPHGPEILKLIDKSSEDKTVANLEAYMRPKKGNYIYEMFYYNHPFYSYNALKNVKVQRRLTSVCWTSAILPAIPA